MKHISLNFSLMLFIIPLFTYAQTDDVKAQTQQQQTNQTGKPTKPEQPYDETTQVVLANFANIVGSFFNIVQDPNNPQNLGSNFTNILGGIVNIALTATKNGDLPINASQEEINEFIKKIDKKIRKKAIKLMLKKIITLKSTQQ